jgi:hypothetical protein
MTFENIEVESKVGYLSILSGLLIWIKVNKLGLEF